MHFMSFMLNFFSYLILAYFVFQIFGRKRIVGIVILLISIAFSIVTVINHIINNKSFIYILLVFVVDALPIVLALILFLYVTRAYKRETVRKTKTLKLKNIHSTIYPSKYMMMISIFGSVISGMMFILLILNYFFEFTEVNQSVSIIIFILAILVCIFSVYQWFVTSQIDYNRIVLYVGKQKEKCYMFNIKSLTRPFEILDVYSNDDFIIDELGTIKVYSGIRLIEKNYIYWIATSQNLEIKDRAFELKTDVFKSYIYDIPKYKKIKIKLILDHGKYREKNK